MGIIKAKYKLKIGDAYEGTPTISDMFGYGSMGETGLSVVPGPIGQSLNSPSVEEVLKSRYAEVSDDFTPDQWELLCEMSSKHAGSFLDGQLL